MFSVSSGLREAVSRTSVGPVTVTHGDSALVRAEPPVYVVGLPGAALFVLGDAHTELGGQADEVGVAGPGLAVADVDEAQAQSAPDGGVGLVDHAGAHGRGAAVDAGSGGDGPVDQDQGSLGVARHLHIPVVHLRLGDALQSRQQDGELRGLAAGHHGVDGNLLHRGQAETGLHHHDHVLGGAPGALEHGLHGGRRGRDDGDTVAPVTLFHEAVHGVQAPGRIVHRYGEDIGFAVPAGRAGKVCRRGHTG